ncbi:MAG: ATP-dependent DNA helicase RecG [Spirochaetia bacterium]|nr:ATP-dependent DNA helicase RecG [Spirochaetia bacterium]
MTEPALIKEIQYVKGVGPQRAKLLQTLGVNTVMDLLFYVPRDWVDRSNVKKIGAVIAGTSETVKGKVVGAETKQVRAGLKITRVMIADGSGYLYGTWFNQPFMEKRFSSGDEVIFHGKIEVFRNYMQINTPEYEIMGSPAADSSAVRDDLVETGRIVPIYPLTENLSQKQFRKIIKYTLDNYLQYMEEYMPQSIIKKHSLMGIKDAVYNAHYPASFSELERAKYRLKFDEFFFMQLAFASKKKKIKSETGRIFKTSGPVFDAFIKNLPFTLTGAQQRVVEELKKDLSSGKPMNRLVQGDVGSGKTIVALAAAVLAKESGCQAAIMVPAEMLASQHMRNIGSLLAKTGIRSELLISAVKKQKREEILQGLKDGAIDILIGTHALIQDEVIFKDLGLAIIDEQHRFGVLQRASLIRKAALAPHTLIMTATPIPRTLSMSVYGDTDISIIDELPPGRKPVKTMLFESSDIFKLYDFIEDKLKNKARVYAVYPLVGESDKLDLKSAIEMEKEWAARFKDHKTAIVHGRMKKEERDAAMDAFKKGDIDILVATTVIEVGIDVPEASVMVIEHAERFGLSQLHQLRGRVGRGQDQSWCLLVGDPKTQDGFKRLQVMESTTDGFKISEADLEIRGPGEFMGTRQHGISEFRIANIIRDKNELDIAREAAFGVVSGECDINHGEKEQLYRIIKQKYSASFDLINIG